MKRLTPLVLLAVLGCVVQRHEPRERARAEIIVLQNAPAEVVAEQLRARLGGGAVRVTIDARTNRLILLVESGHAAELDRAVQIAHELDVPGG